MGAIRFYHMTRDPLEAVLPRLVEKAYAQGHRILIRSPARDRVQQLDQLLWTYRDDSFLPHGAVGAGMPEEQPIWITDAPENANNARLLIATDGAGIEPVDGFEMVCLLFDGRDAEAVTAARGQWRNLQKAGHSLTYWQQSERGNWQQAASA